MGHIADVEGVGGATVWIGRWVIDETGGEDFASGSGGGGVLVWEVGGVDVGGGDGVAVVEVGGERATVFVGSCDLSFDASPLYSDRCDED